MWSSIKSQWQKYQLKYQLKAELGDNLYSFLLAYLKTDEAIMALKTSVEHYPEDRLSEIASRCYFIQDPEQELVFWWLKNRP